MNKFNFLKAYYLGELLTVLIGSLLAIAWVSYTNHISFKVSDMDSWYVAWVDPIITVATFLVAVFVWWDNKDREWKDSLPKRLTVHFKLGNQYVMSCYNLKLGSEPDIRAFSQQIGAQISKERLQFIPGITEQPIRTIRVAGGNYIQYHEVELYLTEAPEMLKGQYTSWIFVKQEERPEAYDGQMTKQPFYITDSGQVYERTEKRAPAFPKQPFEFELERA